MGILLAPEEDGVHPVSLLFLQADHLFSDAIILVHGDCISGSISLETESCLPVHRRLHGVGTVVHQKWALPLR